MQLDISAYSLGMTMDGNQAAAANTTAGYGIGGCFSAYSNNTVAKFATSYEGCSYLSNNASLP